MKKKTKYQGCFTQNRHQARGRFLKTTRRVFEQKFAFSGCLRWSLVENASSYTGNLYAFKIIEQHLLGLPFSQSVPHALARLSLPRGAIPTPRTLSLCLDIQGTFLRQWLIKTLLISRGREWHSTILPPVRLHSRARGTPISRVRYLLSVTLVYPVEKHQELNLAAREEKTAERAGERSNRAEFDSNRTKKITPPTQQP